MPVTSGFYNSLNGDRRYTAQQMGAIFDGLITDGIHQLYGTVFQVLATTGRDITVGIGRAWFKQSWILNDSLLTITADASEASLHRYDEVIIEVDSTDAVRSNVIKIIKGTPSSTPVRPTLTHTSTVNQYSLATIYRAGASASITQGNITNRIGTAETPYTLSVLASNISILSLYDTSGLVNEHRMTFRGANLGTTLTAGQKTQIQAGTFTDLWLGDYWVIGGVNWRIVDIDYWYGVGDTQFNTHHLVIMPDSSLYTSKMNTNNVTSTGYGGSLMRSSGLSAAKTTINAAFPSAVLSRRDIFSSSASSGDITNQTWYTTTVELISEIMLHGSYFYGHDKMVLSNSQLALFMVKPGFKRTNPGVDYWLNNLYDGADFAAFNNSGTSDFYNANSLLGVRPAFAVGI